MREVSTGQLRENLAQWIWHVGQTRESIVVTNYGRPVALLGPPPEEVVNLDGESNTKDA